jgi:hypothetical protein
MKTSLLKLFVMCAALAGLVITSSAKADDCAALVGTIVQQEGATYTSRSLSGNIYFLKHRPALEISVDCGANSLGPMITVDSDRQPFPSESVFLFTARLGSMLTGINPAGLLKSLHEALKQTQAEMAERHLSHGVVIECHAFTRDGGASSFTMSTDTTK